MMSCYPSDAHWSQQGHSIHGRLGHYLAAQRNDDRGPEAQRASSVEEVRRQCEGVVGQRGSPVDEDVAGLPRAERAARAET
jgi:hypothetical protein